jgi:hypothetical protein
LADGFASKAADDRRRSGCHGVSRGRSRASHGSVPWMSSVRSLQPSESVSPRPGSVPSWNSRAFPVRRHRCLRGRSQRHWSDRRPVA